MTKRKLKAMPVFKSAKQEAEFWDEHDSGDYIDWSKAKKAQFPNLKPSSKTISLRLPESLLSSLKMMAHKNDVPYQSLIKLILSDRVAKEQKRVAK